MIEQQTLAIPWMLDSSTFIHAMIVDRVPLLVRLRSPLFFPEYVYRIELGTDAKEITRDAALDHVIRKRIGVERLTLADLDTIASFGEPRRVGLGELACAVIAVRLAGGMLCDDWRAKGWLDRRTVTPQWDSIEGVLLHAAAEGFIGELELFDAQRMLANNMYDCRENLQLVHVQRQRQLHQERSAALNGE